MSTFSPRVESSGNATNRAAIIGFDVIAVFCVVGLLLVICTAAVSRQVRRQAIWYGFMVPSTLYTASFFLSFGYQFRSDRDPPLGLCLTQTVLLYALPVWCTTSFACFVNYIYLLLKMVVYKTKISPRLTTFLITLPPISFIIMLILEFSLILARPEIKANVKMHPTRLYCHTSEKIPGLVAAIVAIPTIILWFGGFGMLCILFKTGRSRIKCCEAVLESRIRALLIRTALLTVLGATALCIAIRQAIVQTEENALASYQFLTLPFLMLLIWGTQKDMLRCWTCRGPELPPKTFVDTSHPDEEFGY